jgi:hypothetical protein
VIRKLIRLLRATEQGRFGGGLRRRLLLLCRPLAQPEPRQRLGEPEIGPEFLRISDYPIARLHSLIRQQNCAPQSTSASKAPIALSSSTGQSSGLGASVSLTSPLLRPAARPSCSACAFRPAPAAPPPACTSMPACTTQCRPPTSPACRILSNTTYDPGQGSPRARLWRNLFVRTETPTQ